jgi:predicted Zn-dependent peptidase
MKKICIIIILCLIAVFIWRDRTGAEQGAPVKNSFLKDLPEVKKHNLKNDLKILYLENDLPVTVIYASISYGKLHETAANAGISDVVVRALQISGTSLYPGNTMYQKLESIGGQIQIAAGWETIDIEIKVLSEHSTLAFSILGDLIRNPLFNETDLQSAKKLVLEKIIRDRDKPEEAGVLKLREIIFGGTGYGSVPGEKSISGIDLSAVKELWKRYATGNNITLAVSSSMDNNAINRFAEKEFSILGKGIKEYYTFMPEKALSDIKSSSGVIYLIPRELEQATIYIGTLSPDIKYDGNYALYLMNYILGGGSFTSRLMYEIRVKRGLAYSVFSVLRNRRNTGVFISFVQTRNETVREALTIMNENINKMQKEPVTDEELKWAKESIKNSYIFRFNTIYDILGNYIEMEYNGLDADYYKKYLNNINKVTGSDVLKESRNLFGQGLVTVIVGKKDLEKELSSFGQVVICK